MSQKTNLPYRNSYVSRTLGKLMMRSLRWSVEGDLPDHPKMVVIAGPHSSNWDWVVGMAAMFNIDIRISWLGKHTLFKPPLGLLMRKLGGVPVDRKKTVGVVDQIVSEFRMHSKFILALAPSGSRNKGAKLKSGFYQIAKAAEVPILPIFFDNAQRKIRIGQLIAPEQSLEQVLLHIEHLFCQFQRR